MLSGIAVGLGLKGLDKKLRQLGPVGFAQFH